MATAVAELAQVALMGLRLIVFGLALGLTVISFQAYRQRQTKRLETAFVGFAFISMGIALTTLRPSTEPWSLVFELVETFPLIIGFSMFYLSLYR